MTSQSISKIRLVKCPKCGKVLPELSNVPVYLCGGCDAVLQVKRSKNGANDPGLQIHEMDTSQKNEVQHDFEDMETREEANEAEQPVNKITETDDTETKVSDEHQSGNMNYFRSGKESFEPNKEETADDQDKFLLKQINGDFKDEKGSAGPNLADEVDSLTELGHCESGELSPISVDLCKSQQNNCQIEESSPVDEACDKKSKGFENNNGTDQVSPNGTDQVSPSNELTSHEIEDLSPETGTSSEFDKDAICHYIFGNLKKEKLSAVDPTNSVLTPQKVSRESTSAENLSPPHIEKLEQSQRREATEVEPITSKDTLETKESPVNQNLCNQVLPPNEIGCQELEDSSPVIMTRTESKGKNLLVVSPGGSVTKSPVLSEENTISPDNEQVEKPQLRETSKFDSASSEETFENIAFTNAASTHKSNHAYDGSESSLGETDDQDHDQYLRQLKGKSTEAELSQVNALPSSSYFDSFSRERNPYSRKGFIHRRDQLHEPTGHGRPAKSRLQSEGDERLSRAHFHSRASTLGYKYGSSSNYVPKQVHSGKIANLPPMPEDAEEEKLKLKKMVLELQDQLNRSRIPKGYDRQLKHVPPCYHASSEMERSRDLTQNGYPNGCCHRETFPNQCRFSHIPFSAEAEISRPQMGHSCLQYSPREWHCSAPISPHLYCKPIQCAARLNCHHCNVHCPCSDFSTKGCEMMFNDDWGKHREKKNYGERNYALRRHVLPVKGGAPFVVCDQCSNLLQLPRDFLLFKKRYHRLRCSSCSYILKFSLHNGYRLEREADNESSDLAPAPPPSEVSDLRDVNKGKKMSYGSNCPHVDLVCFSDDYGPSICKSCSTETEPQSVVIPYDVHRRESNLKKISGGSVDHQNWGGNQPILKESQNIYRDRISKAEKPSPVTERLQGRDVSPLHKLMGYNSAREVLNKW